MNPTTLALPALLWAQASENPLEDMGRNFRLANQDFRWSNVFLVLAIIAAMAMAISLLVRYMNARENYTIYSPQRLFRELCKAHGLEHKKRRVLKRLAVAHQLASPAQLFVEPERFDVGHLNADWQAQRSELEALRDLIFGCRMEAFDNERPV
ncbi:MAG TPA: hypothetical protein VL096_07750 [Pirellulaceae bacterium]|nr:hypothetical protein [Pirellulaceae bacterium]